jgi:hypothetical protein
MTLIISKSSRDYVLQVTDRLVTRSGASFDPLANKNILFCALNGILSFAYTGHAYIGGTPTDQWLAEQLIGKNFIIHDGLPAIECGPTKLIYIGPALQILIEALNKAFDKEIEPNFKKDWFEKRFDLCFVGYVWNKKGKFRPFCGDIFKPPSSKKFWIIFSDRNWYYEAHISGAPVANISQEQLESLMVKLRNKVPDEAENLIVELIREISKNISIVGSDCMSIFIPSPSVAHTSPIRVKFIPKIERIIDVPNIGDNIKTIYSPWVIGPRMFIPPAMLGNTGFNARLGRCLYEVKMEAPNIPGKGMFHESQKRKLLN